MRLKPEIIFEDDHIVALAKPPGMLTIPDRHAPELDNVLGFLREKYGEIFTVHRLDKMTSGLLIFAKNAKAHRHLSLQFEHRSVKKFYQALVEGLVASDEGDIDSPLGPHPTRKDKMIVIKGGKPSHTRYKVLKRYKFHTLLEVEILTGRMHQIRVHLDSIGYPLAVDEVYGKRGEIFIADIKRNKLNQNIDKEPRPLMARNSLHSWRIEFWHPETEELLNIEAPMPKDFKALINQIEKWAG
jgi:RluA family pseudouridine synthase